MANSVDLDQTSCSAASDLGLHCLQSPICPKTVGYYSKHFCKKIFKDIYLNDLLIRFSAKILI